jgi:hypothetical protein
MYEEQAKTSEGAENLIDMSHDWSLVERCRAFMKISTILILYLIL